MSGRRKRKSNPPPQVAIKQEIEDETETPQRRQKSGRSQGSSLLMKVKKEKDDSPSKRKDVMPVTISPPDSRSGKEDGSLKMKFILSPKAEPSEEENEEDENEVANKWSKNTPKEGTSKKNSGLKLKFSFKPNEGEPKGKAKASRKRDSENVTPTDEASLHPKKRFKTSFEEAMKVDAKSGAESAKKKNKLTKLDSDSGYSDAQSNVQASLKPAVVDSPIPEKKNEIDKKKDKKKKRKEKDKKKKFFKTKSDKNRFLNVHRSSDEGEDGWIEERGLLKAPKAPSSSEYEIISSWTNREIPVKEEVVEIPMQPIKLKKDKKSKSRSKNKSKRKHGKKSKKFLHLEKKKKDKESFTQEQIIKIQQRLMVQGLKSPSSGGHDLGGLNFSSHGDDLISQLTASSDHFDPSSLLDESPTEEAPLKPVLVKSNDKKSERSKLKDKAKKKKPISAYMMWCKANRAHVVEQFPGLDFASYSRKLGELWHKLPEKEKTKWKHKQRSLMMKHKNVPALSRMKKQVKLKQRGITKTRPKFKFPPPHTDPIDIAAHLKLLGESLGNVGRNLMSHAGSQGETEVHGSVSVLMDSMLSAIAPLMCLTSQVEEMNVIPQKTQASLLENIAYIMPGL